MTPHCRQAQSLPGENLMMNSINLNNLTMRGELSMRANLNYARLETAKYWPETIFEMDEHAWPADWEGWHHACPDHARPGHWKGTGIP